LGLELGEKVEFVMLKPTGGWGYHSDTEILFPMRVAPSLNKLRGETWKRLVAEVCRAPDTSIEQLAFSLVLIRVNGCLTCHTDCYRAMRGCSVCASMAVRRFRGSDEELRALYDDARWEVAAYLEDEGILLKEPVSELEGKA
jgi:hypothetical protein